MAEDTKKTEPTTTEDAYATLSREDAIAELKALKSQASEYSEHFKSEFTREYENAPEWIKKRVKPDAYEGNFHLGLSDLRELNALATDILATVPEADKKAPAKPDPTNTSPANKTAGKVTPTGDRNSNLAFLARHKGGVQQ